MTIEERRDGGLLGVWFTFPVSGGSNCDYLGPRYRGKLEEVLKFLADPLVRHPYRFHEAPAYTNDPPILNTTTPI